MIDKILMAARKVAADYKIHEKPGRPPAFLTPEAEAARQRLPERVIETDVEAFEELMRLVNDYFHPGRAAGGGLCKKCGAPLLWIKTSSGANAPLDAVMIAGIDADGVAHRIYLNHFSTCPKADEVRREKNAADTPENGKTQAAGR